jgi:hypothetical protein
MSWLRGELEERDIPPPARGSYARALAKGVGSSTTGSWYRRAYEAQAEEVAGVGSWRTRLRVLLEDDDTVPVPRELAHKSFARVAYAERGY